MTTVNKINKPEPKNKKTIIIAAVVVFVCLTASGGLYFMMQGEEPKDGEFGRRRFEWNDSNMPDPHKQSYEKIMAYRNSDKFNRLSPQEQMRYMGASMRTVMDHHVETYYTLPEEKKTAYLDSLIDEMQAQRAKFEQMRNQFPRPQRPRDGNDVNDPNRAARRAERMAQRNNPSNARARREQGNPEERAKQMQFMQAMQKRMKERGISMPRFDRPGGRGGSRGGR
ncbi:MAG: hypothetical protein ABFD79_04450 [Phycisphaerales bacterium]